MCIDDIRDAYDSILYEAQTLKMMKNKHLDHMAEIKEEIIELNFDS